MDKAQKTKAAIANAAFEVVSERGLDGATFNRIAERAGCAKGLVNYHYPSRMELFAEVASLASKRLWRQRIEALSQSTGTAVVERTWQILLDERASGIHLALASLSSLRSSEQIDQQFKLDDRSRTEVWRSAVGEWLEKSEFRTDSQDEIALAVTAILQGFAGMLADVEPDDLYPAYITAWLGLTAAIAAGRA